MQLSRISWIGLVSAAAVISAFGQQATPPAPAPLGPKAVSLDDCIRMALQDNLTLQVGDRVAIGEAADLDIRSGGSLGVEDSKWAVESSLGYYDPEVRMSGGKRYQRRPFQFEPNFGQFISPGTRLNEDVTLGIDGVLPATGTRYELSAGMNRLTGTRLDNDEDSATFGQFLDLDSQYTADTRIRVTQPLLRDFWIDSGRLNIRLRRQDLRISEHSLRLLTMDLVQRVALAYYDLIAAKDQVKTREKALELARQLVEENKKKAAAGAIAPLEVRQSESRESTARADLTAAQFLVEQTENRLRGLVTHDYSTAQHMTFEPSEKLVPVYQAIDMMEAYRNGLESRPDFLMEKEQVEKRRIELSYRKNQLYPALDLVGTYGRNGVDTSLGASVDAISDNRAPYYGGAAVLSFPFTFKSDRANYNRAKVQQKVAITSLKRREDLVLQEINTAVKQVRSAYQQIESTRDARKFAEEALDSEQKKYDAGRSTSFEVLQFQKDLTDARAAEIQAAANYTKALHELYFREGTTLLRNKVQFEIK